MRTADYDGGMIRNLVFRVGTVTHFLTIADVCVCIYDPRLVDSFVNSPISHEPDNFMKANFEDLGNIQQVSEMADELEQLKGDPDARRQRLQESLLLGLSNPPVGQYSKFHENAAYVHGYDAPETVRLAFMRVIISTLRFLS